MVFKKDKFKRISLKREAFDSAEKIRADLGYKSVPSLLVDLIEDKKRKVFGR